MKRPYAEINLNILRENIRKIKEIIGPEVKLMGVVKADGYGHGAVRVSKVLKEEGAAYLGVVHVDEGVELRKNGIDMPILVLSEQEEDEINDIIRHNLSQTVYSYDFAKKLSLSCENEGKKIKVHVKMDTGMGRIGIKPEKVSDLITKIKDLPGLEIEGLFTHFAKSYQPESDYTLKQFGLFIKKAEEIRQKICKIPYLHTANSAAVKNFPETYLDMVRVGIALYKNVLQFKTKVAFVKEVEAGTSLSYGGTYITKGKTRIVTLPVGYSNGYNRLLSNNGEVLIRGKRYPVVGIVCMDMTLVDVGQDDFIRAGDEAVLIGRSQDEFISAEKFADECQTIDYEVLCSIGSKVPRYYIDEKTSDEVVLEDRAWSMEDRA